MSTVSRDQKYCCTCKHFGGNVKIQSSIIEYENTNHVCKIGARGYGNINPSKTSACSKWEPV